MIKHIKNKGKKYKGQKVRIPSLNNPNTDFMNATDVLTHQKSLDLCWDTKMTV